jgi:hypothetical protein
MRCVGHSMHQRLCHAPMSEIYSWPHRGWTEAQLVADGNERPRIMVEWSVCGCDFLKLIDLILKK